MRLCFNVERSNIFLKSNAYSFLSAKLSRVLLKIKIDTLFSPQLCDFVQKSDNFGFKSSAPFIVMEPSGLQLCSVLPKENSRKWGLQWGNVKQINESSSLKENCSALRQLGTVNFKMTVHEAGR